MKYRCPKCPRKKPDFFSGTKEKPIAVCRCGYLMIPKLKLPMPNPVRIELTEKLAGQCANWLAMMAMVGAQVTARPKDKWTETQKMNIALYLNSKLLEEIATQLIELYDSQYPKDEYRR